LPSLTRLVATGQIWCVATLRVDFYAELLQQPALKTLKEAGSSMKRWTTGRY
jgi:hypothetical protein